MKLSGKEGVYVIRLGSTLPKDILLECTWYLVSLVEAEADTKWVDRGLIIFRHRMLYRRTAAACVDMRYTISTSSSGIRYDGSTLPKYTLLECTWYLVSLVEAEPDTKWVDRGFIISRHRMLSSHGCCGRRYTIHDQYLIAKYLVYNTT